MTRGQRSLYFALLAIGVLLVVRFGMYWFSAGRLIQAKTIAGQIGAMATFVLLTFVIWQRQLTETVTWWVCRGIADRRVRPIPAPQSDMKVALITTFVPGAEPIDMLRRTLAAMVLVSYPHDTWVLDEGNDENVQILCDSLGVSYFTRANIAKYNTDGGVFARRTKGGNHNAWYAEHAERYDFVAQIDTDFVAHPEFLSRTLGYFEDSTVAFVGTPQIYGNVGTSLIARGAAQQTYLFYGAIMRGFGDRGHALLIGANHIVRVAALQDIGYYVAHLTEDLATGMTLHSRGWRSVYVPETLLVGEGPTTWQAYFNQQYRWAFGCLDILFMRTPRLVATMRIKLATMYPLVQTFYFNGIALGTGIGLLLYYFVTGNEPARITLGELLVYYAPLVLWRQAITLWLQKFNVNPELESGPLWAGRLITVAAMPIYLLAFFGVLRRRRMYFKVTPKGNRVGANVQTLRVFKPHFVLSAACFVGAWLGYTFHHTDWPLIGWAVTTGIALAAVPLVEIVWAWLQTRAVRAGKLIPEVTFSFMPSHHLRRSPLAVVPWPVGEADADAV